MQIQVNSDSENFIKQKISEGSFVTPQELVEEGIRLVKEKDIIRKYRIAELNAKLKAGMKSLAEGNSFSEEEVDQFFSEKFGF